MKLAILAVGHRQPAWVQEGCEEYLKRLPRELATDVIEIRPEPRNDHKSREQILLAEKARLCQALRRFGDQARLIALDEKGRDFDTRQFAETFSVWLAEGRDTVFLIGGADGLDITLKTKADALLRLSSLTLPHGLARLLLCEQLYRTMSLLKNHPYHRE